MLRKGFTLIELLIVIAVLGILSAAILAAIDPLQQIKKGRDTGVRNVMVEYSNALLRYNATQSTFPWGTGTVATGALSGLGTYTTALINNGELKSNFTAAATATTLGKIFLTAPTASSATLCFNPESKSFNADPQAIYTTNAGGTGAGCPNTTGGTTCYMCVLVQ